MTSRVEELQRMCDNINENGGLDSGEWHTALLAQIAQNLAVIADVMVADRKIENSSEKPNNWEAQKRCDECIHFDRPYTKRDKDGMLIIGVECDGMDEPCDKWTDEPQTDCAWR